MRCRSTLLSVSASHQHCSVGKRCSPSALSGKQHLSVRLNESSSRRSEAKSIIISGDSDTIQGEQYRAIAKQVRGCRCIANIHAEIEARSHKGPTRLGEPVV